MAKVQLNVWVEEVQRDAVKAKAAAAGVSVGRLVVEAVLGAEAREPLADREARDRADQAMERVAGVESSQDSFERRLSRLEEMAGL